MFRTPNFRLPTIMVWRVDIMTNFLLVGNGAREHIIAEKAVESGAKLFSCMAYKHPAISRLCEKSGGAYKTCDICNPSEVAEFAGSQGIELAFASPDEVLAKGVSDGLIRKGIPCASPTQAASRIEWDKAYARELLSSHNVPGMPKFGIFLDETEAAEFIDAVGDVAVKPAGLTGGKGVKVSGVQLNGRDEAVAYAKEVLRSGMGGLPQVVIEEKLVGEEFTLQSFVDGKIFIPMPLVQDFKLAYEGDTGQNTGGMGSYSCADHRLPFLSQDDYESAIRAIEGSIRAMASEANRFKGVLYGQFIITKDGVKLIEFNARFGDPEAMNVLSVFDGNLIDVFKAMGKGELGGIRGQVKFKPLATVCKYLVPDGYPEKPLKDQPIKIAGTIAGNLRYYFASVYEKEGQIYTTGSRAVGLVGVAPTLGEAEKIAERGTSLFTGRLRHRSDIANEQMIKAKVDKIAKLTGIKN